MPSPDAPAAEGAPPSAFGEQPPRDIAAPAPMAAVAPPFRKLLREIIPCSSHSLSLRQIRLAEVTLRPRDGSALIGNRCICRWEHHWISMILSITAVC